IPLWDVVRIGGGCGGGWIWPCRTGLDGSLGDRHPPPSPSRSHTQRDPRTRTGSESVDVEAVAATAVGADQPTPVLLRLDDGRQAQALRARRGQDGLAALPGLAPLGGLVQGKDDLRLDRAEPEAVAVAAHLLAVGRGDEGALLHRRAARGEAGLKL